MKGFSKWSGALAASVLLPGPAVAGDAIAAGKVKAINAEKKEFDLTDSAGKNWTFPMGDAEVRVNRRDSKFRDVKIGDKALAIVEKMGEDTTPKCLMIERKEQTGQGPGWRLGGHPAHRGTQPDRARR